MPTICLSSCGARCALVTATVRASPRALLSPVLTNIDPAMLHRSWDGPKEPTSKAQSLAVEVSHDLMTFTINARGSKGTCHQG